MKPVYYDVVIAGGGLAGGLVALALRRRHPGLRIAVVEGGAQLGGNHTWSCFATDLDGEGEALLDPLFVQRLAGVEVLFADHQRQLGTGYLVLTSASLDRGVRPALDVAGSRLYLDTKVLRVAADHVLLDDGQQLHAPIVFDGRGPAGAPRFVENQGFQKFVGFELGVPDAGTPAHATIMDARVPQLDGFRFIYRLPLAPTRLLIEDTYYSDDPRLDLPAVRARLRAYLERHGLGDAPIVREEAGVLGVPFAEDGVPPLGMPVRLGVRGGWAHPTTGYTLPFAARVATTLAAHLKSNGAIDPGSTLRALAVLHRKLERHTPFARQLNRLLFRAVAPEDRWQVLSRFYRLPQPTIERFYALASTPMDRARVLVGRPPRGVSLRSALRVLQAT